MNSMARGALMLNRAEMLRALPKHVFFALISGAVAGLILYFLNQIELDGQWNLLMAIPIGAIYVNAAMIPLAIPGKHWSFAFIGAMLMFMLMFAGAIISRNYAFPFMSEFNSKIVNFITVEFILSGGCIGLFYGMFCGRTSAIVVGVALGSAVGYTLGLVVMQRLIWRHTVNDQAPQESWAYNSPLHFAWQLGLAMALLHLGACLGATMGAGPANPQSQIRNPKS